MGSIVSKLKTIIYNIEFYLRHEICSLSLIEFKSDKEEVMNINKKLSVAIVGACLAAATPAWSQADKPSDRSQDGARPGTASKPGTQDSDQTKKLQMALQSKGFYSGPVDGVMSDTTRESIRAFQKSKNLNVTGNIDDNTARELGL